MVLALIISSCGQTTGSTPDTSPSPRTLTVMTHDSFAASESVISSFETANNIKVQFIASGDAGTALNKAILSKDNPIADVFYGVDNTFLSRALTEDIFEPYNSPNLAALPSQFKMDPQNRALPVDWGDVCLNYDIPYFSDRNLQVPKNLEDLLKPEYKSLLVVENPATSSTGLAFLLATIGHFGADNYLDYWSGLLANNVLVVNDWETAYYTNFSRWGGDKPIVVSYGSSPPFEVIESESPDTIPQTAVITSDGSCFRQVEFVGILRGTKNRDLAQIWIDFMLSTTFQVDLPLQMYVFPVNSSAILDETFQKYLSIPEHPAYVSPDDIAANRESWINAWTEVVLR
ncbi:MAG: ABC transporter substrate-binding protein [Chloroflexi bacterium RBG_16_47_49]|nr:MAG: ABC transporter substrate-binding protein [Chloroflexi bacterium RBG_16_47_49]